MSKNEWKKWAGVVGRLLLAYVLVFSQSAFAGQNQQAKDKPAGSQNKVAAQSPAAQQKASAATQGRTIGEAEESESAVAEKKGPDDAAHRGIKVHGHWTIESDAAK